MRASTSSTISIEKDYKGRFSKNDVIYKRVKSAKFKDFLEIRAGALIGIIMVMKPGEVNGGTAVVSIPIQVCPSAEYSQEIFEKDLRELLDKLVKIKTAVRIVMEVLFAGGGSLRFPEWFLEECQKAKIRLFVEYPKIEPSEPF